MIELLSAAFLLMSVPAIIWLRRIRRHDHVLFLFCQIRRDAMALVRERQFDFEREDYIALRNLIELLNTTIDNYNEYKTVVFNVRRLANLLIKYRKTARRFDDKLRETHDPTINALSHRFVLAMMEAFLAYTPLIRLTLMCYHSERAVAMLVRFTVGIGNFALNALYAVRIRYANTLARRIKKCTEFVLKQQDQLNSSRQFDNCDNGCPAP